MGLGFTTSECTVGSFGGAIRGRCSLTALVDDVARPYRRLHRSDGRGGRAFRQRDPLREYHLGRNELGAVEEGEDEEGLGLVHVAAVLPDVAQNLREDRLDVPREHAPPDVGEPKVEVAEVHHVDLLDRLVDLWNVVRYSTGRHVQPFK